MSQVKPLQSSSVATQLSFWKSARFSHNFLFLDNNIIVHVKLKIIHNISTKLLVCCNPLQCLLKQLD